MDFYPAPSFSADTVEAVDLLVTDDAVINDDCDVVGDLTAGTIASDAALSGTVVTGSTSVSTPLAKVTATPGAHAAAPDLAFGDLDTGVWESADDTLKFGTAGSERMSVDATGLAVTGTVTATGAIKADGMYASNGSAYMQATPGVATTVNGGRLVSAYALCVSTTSPAGLTADVTDYSPTGWSSTTALRLSSDSNWKINSLGASAAGALLWLINISAFTITLLHDDGATGTAANRFVCPNSVDFAILKNSAVLVMYDATSLRWRVLSQVA